MPQFSPFLMLSQISYAILGLGLLTYCLSEFVLPQFVFLQVIRRYVFWLYERAWLFN